MKKVRIVVLGLILPFAFGCTDLLDEVKEDSDLSIVEGANPLPAEKSNVDEEDTTEFPPTPNP